MIAINSSGLNSLGRKLQFQWANWVPARMNVGVITVMHCWLFWTTAFGASPSV